MSDLHTRPIELVSGALDEQIAQGADRMQYLCLRQRAAELFDQGRRTAYAIGYAIVTDPAAATHLHICLGEQWSGRRLYMVDLDTHSEGQDADAAKRAFEAERPELAAKLDWHRSKSNTGWHAYFESSVQISTGKLYDQAGQHIGELLGKDSDRTIDPGNVRIPCLHVGEIERLLNVWHVKGSDPKGEQWKDRAKQGASWTRGYTRMQVTKDELRAHLKRNCGWRGAAADALFGQREAFDRSAAFGRLVQTLMLHAHRIPGQQNTGFPDKCKAVMAYAIASDAYGKAGGEGYTFEKDAASLIAQIVNEDPYGAGLQWKAPFWAKGNTATTASAPLPAPEAPRPAHRPAGDRSRHLVTFRRVLESIEPDDFGRRTYTLDYLADKMKIARCAVAPRTLQSYLHELRTAGEIVTAQIGGNGTPYAVMTRCFGGADNYQKRVEIDPEPDTIGGADPIADERIETPKSEETPHVCIVDHQDPGVPTHQPPGATYLPGRDWTNGGHLDLSDWRDPIEMRVRAEPIDRTPPRVIRRQPRQKGQESFMGRDGIAAKITRKKRHGAAPTPAPYRPRAALVIESLPEPPAPAAPAGAQCCGDPLPAPQAGPAQRMAERQRRLRAEREAAHVE